MLEKLPTFREAFLADAHGRDHVTHAEMAFDEAGKIVSLRAFYTYG